MKLTTVATIIFFVIGIGVACQSSKNSSSSGQQLYNQHCANCHMSSGDGLGDLIPSIKQSIKFSSERNTLACLIKNGILVEQDNEITDNYSMPANADLSTIEIVNILNYIRKEWHANQEVFTLEEIKNSLDSCIK